MLRSDPQVSLEKNENSPHFDFPPRPPLSVASQHSSYTEPGEGFNFEKKTIEYFTPLKVSGEGRSGYELELNGREEQEIWH